VGTGTLDFNLTGLTYQDIDITVSGATAGHPVSLGVPDAAMKESGVYKKIQYFAWCKDATHVTVRCMKACDETDPNPGSGLFTVYVW
jgi:hypothetical protein